MRPSIFVNASLNMNIISCNIEINIEKLENRMFKIICYYFLIGNRISQLFDISLVKYIVNVCVLMRKYCQACRLDIFKTDCSKIKLI